MKWGMSDMTRSRYYFNSSIIRQNFRQHGWIGIIYALGLMFALPLQLFMSIDPNAKPQEIDHLFRISGNVQALFIITIPVAAGLFYSDTFRQNLHQIYGIACLYAESIYLRLI